MTIHVNQIVDAADPFDIEDIDLRRRIAEALIATDLNLPLGTGSVATTLVSCSPSRAWHVRRAEPAARRRPRDKAILARYH